MKKLDWSPGLQTIYGICWEDYVSADEITSPHTLPGQ